MLAETREEDARADAKAQIIVAAAVVVVSVIVAGIIGGKWSPSDLACWGRFGWWAGAAAGAIAIRALGFGVYPRLKRTGAHRLAYFEDVPKYAAVGDLARDLEKEA